MAFRVTASGFPPASELGMAVLLLWATTARARQAKCVKLALEVHPVIMVITWNPIITVLGTQL